MSSNIVLTPTLFINAVSATTTSNWIPIDCSYSGVQDRSISGYRSNSNGTFKLLTKTQVPNFDKNGVFSTALSVEVTATVTSWGVSGRNYFSTGISLPCTHIRVIKTDAQGLGTVVGVV